MITVIKTAAESRRAFGTASIKRLATELPKVRVTKLSSGLLKFQTVARKSA